MSKTETQSDALRLAELLAVRRAFDHGRIGTDRRFVEMDATVVASVDAELRRLDAENKALRADAERYRWLRANAAEFLICVTDATGRLCNDKADAEAAIDACIVPDAAAKTGDAA